MQDRYRDNNRGLRHSSDRTDRDTGERGVIGAHKQGIFPDQVGARGIDRGKEVVAHTREPHG